MFPENPDRARHERGVAPDHFGVGIGHLLLGVGTVFYRRPVSGAIVLQAWLFTGTAGGGADRLFSGVFHPHPVGGLGSGFSPIWGGAYLPLHPKKPYPCS